MRTDPAPSVPMARLPMPTASAATPPPEDPPDVRPIFHGLCVAPNSFESVTPFQPYSGEVVLPSSTVPASRSRWATGESTFHGPASSVAALPMRVGMPLVSTMSLMVIGTPSMSLRRLPPFFQRFSEARAARSALSGSRCWNALSCGFSASMRAIAARVASTGEALRALNSLTSSWAGIIARSAVISCSPEGGGKESDGLRCSGRPGAGALRP